MLSPGVKKFLFIVLMLVAQTSSAEIYKWVDEYGRVVYDDKPPVHMQKEALNIREEVNTVKGLSGERAEKRKKLLDAIDEDRQLKKEQEAKEKKKKARMQKQCHVARDNLRLYQRSHSVYDLDKDGNRVTLPSSARDQAIANTKKQIKQYCK